MDLGTALGEQGFKWIFVLNAHGSPNHHRALSQAGADLVNPGYRAARPYPTHDARHAAEVASAADWLGYFGSPAAASAAYGAKYWERYSAWSVDLALRALDGREAAQAQRVEDITSLDGTSPVARPWRAPTSRFPGRDLRSRSVAQRRACLRRPNNARACTASIY